MYKPFETSPSSKRINCPEISQPLRDLGLVLQMRERYNEAERLLNRSASGLTHEHDPQTFRLVHMLTRRNATAFPGDCPLPLEDWLGAELALHLRSGWKHHGGDSGSIPVRFHSL